MENKKLLSRYNVIVTSLKIDCEMKKRVMVLAVSISRKGETVRFKDLFIH